MTKKMKIRFDEFDCIDRYILTSQEEELVRDIRDIILKSRKRTFSAINTVMINTYWRIGERIVQHEQRGSARADYGTFLIKKLAIALKEEFGGGLSIANLKNFRQFYLRFPRESKGYALCNYVSWSHIRMIMRLDSEEERDYYLNESREQRWSVRTLERKIKTKDFQRLLSTQQSPSALALNAEKPPGALHFIKDPYILEFLGLEGEGILLESSLESAIISHMQKFLLEMGKGFSFVARQMRVSSETSHFYVDLVFYNYLLKCFVLIDLKTSKLTHQDIGQMDMYVRMFDDLKRGPDDNPTIGIIFCSDKDETIVKYSVLNEARHLFASKYKTILPTEEELQDELGGKYMVLSERLGEPTSDD